MKKIAVILLILALLAGGGAFAYHQMMGASTLTEEVKVEIPEASSTDAIGAILAENGVVKSELGFKLQVKKDGAASELKAGTYHFKAGKYSLGDVVDCLMKGPAVSGVKVTIPEGYNQTQIVGLLVDAGLCTEEAFLEAAANCDFGYDYLPAEGDSLRLQGFLFPDTYYFTEGDSAEGMISMMLKEFDSYYTDEWRARVTELGLTTQQWVTMASIVEKEAVVSEDRPIIAGVFYNRLEAGMNLQSCATVQYALGEVKPVLSNEDVQVDSPYNTYINPGLPPGPIASPGYESLYAALYPTESNYLFFVAKPNGAHIFTETYEEHLVAKADIENGLYDNEQ
ncbi:MAG: endolytic transglycosylase MltG [Clostridia bacterium]